MQYERKQVRNRRRLTDETLLEAVVRAEPTPINGNPTSQDIRETLHEAAAIPDDDVLTAKRIQVRLRSLSETGAVQIAYSLALGRGEVTTYDVDPSIVGLSGSLNHPQQGWWLREMREAVRAVHERCDLQRLSRSRYEEMRNPDQPSENRIRKRFGGWLIARRAAGVEPNSEVSADAD